jgi:hypothetical protein
MSEENPTERAEDHGKESLRIMVARIDERVKYLKTNLESQTNKCPIDMEKLCTRLTSLETDRAKVWGGAAILSLVIAWVTAYLRR